VSSEIDPSRPLAAAALSLTSSHPRARAGAWDRRPEGIALSTPGTLEATQALELVQIDHTLADVIIHRAPCRRSASLKFVAVRSGSPTPSCRQVTLAPRTATAIHRCRSDKRPTSVVPDPLHAPG
jgi:hypothetical protein